jgi:hypothetical protein
MQKLHKPNSSTENKALLEIARDGGIVCSWTENKPDIIVANFSAHYWH